jgi:SAM-dependent methyltransferase
MGDFLTEARRSGWLVAGTELSRCGAQAARARGVSIAEGEIWEAQLPAAAFDIVTAWHVIEHVPDPRRFLEEIYRILLPGGWLVLATPNLQNYIFRAAYTVLRGHPPRFYDPNEGEIQRFGFSMHSLRRLVGSVGFADVSVGFDRHAAVTWGKRMVDATAYVWSRLSGLHWGMGLELTARKPSIPSASPARPSVDRAS